MPPAPNPGPEEGDYYVGSIGWLCQRKADEDFFTGCAFGVMGTIMFGVVLWGVFNG